VSRRESAERDRRLIEKGEPPWGNVLPGTDEVAYYRTVRRGARHPWWRWRRPTETVLFRTVSKLGAFYTESYAGQGRWVSDSDAAEDLLTDPAGHPGKAKAISAREAGELMAKRDNSGPLG
jgi:hypothetical protein